MRDPVSTQFRNLRHVPKWLLICGEINAKNAFGGYVGFTPFSYYTDDDFVTIIDPSERIKSMNELKSFIMREAGCVDKKLRFIVK